MKNSLSIRKVIAALLLLTMPAYFSILRAQNDSLDYKTYNGIVKNAETKETLPYASVIVEGTNVATVTNIDGEFIIKVKNDLNAEKLHFSSLGYKNKSIPLTEFDQKKPPVIRLEPLTEFIKELKVRPSGADEIIDQVLFNIHKNYLTKPMMMRGFYRETIQARKKYVGISEAVVNIYKAPYDKIAQFDQVKIDKGRKSADVAEMDTLFVKLQGGPAVTMLLDVIKNPYSVLTQEYKAIYDFDLENVVSINDRLHYVISFTQKEDIDKPYFNGKLYVEIDRLAISEAVFSLNLQNKAEASKVFIRKKPAGVKITPVKTSYRANYSIQDNTWFFNYARAEIKFKLNWKKKLFNSSYTLMSELAITDKYPDYALKIPRKDRFQEKDFMEEKVYAFFDPEFWGDYNLIEPDASIESAIRKLYRKNK